MKYLLKHLILLLTVLPIFTIAKEVNIIANSAVPLNELSSREIKRVFLGKNTVWSNGSTITPCLLETAELMPVFYKDIVGKSAKGYRSYWNKKLFSGNGILPKKFKTKSKLLEFVQNEPGAICYIGPLGQTRLEEAKGISLSD